jgi:heavy metal sensor kinase
VANLSSLSVRTRLTLWYTAALAGLLAVLGAAALLLLDRGLRANVDATLESLAQAVAASSQQPSRFGPDVDAALDALLGPSFTRRFFQLLDPSGRPDPRIVPRTRLPLSVDAVRNAERGRATFETVRLETAPPIPIRVLTQPIIERGRMVQLVQVALPLDSVDDARRRFLLILLGLAPIALAAAASGGWLLAGRALAPVDSMVAAARRISAEGLSQRLGSAPNDDELGRLANVLNDMLGRLERSFTMVSQFSADAAHELRTPLTILKGEIEVALSGTPSVAEYQRVLASCLEEVDRLAALVEDLLFLARADAGGVELNERADLAAVITDVQPALEALADRAHVTLTVRAGESVTVRGSAPMLFRALFNLGDNAIKYCTGDGRVDLDLVRHDPTALIRVRDNGPGIAAAELPRIFDRFYRGDPARSRGGTGLGLALTKAIVDLHGGTISVESAVGQGSTFEIRLPVQA